MRHGGVVVVFYMYETSRESLKMFNIRWNLALQNFFACNEPFND